MSRDTMEIVASLANIARRECWPRPFISCCIFMTCLDFWDLWDQSSAASVVFARVKFRCYYRTNYCRKFILNFVTKSLLKRELFASTKVYDFLEIYEKWLTNYYNYHKVIHSFKLVNYYSRIRVHSFFNR